MLAQLRRYVLRLPESDGLPSESSIPASAAARRLPPRSGSCPNPGPRPLPREGREGRWILDPPDGEVHRVVVLSSDDTELCAAAS